MATSPDSPVGAQDAEGLVSDGRRQGAPSGVEPPPEPHAAPSSVPAGTPVEASVSIEPIRPRRASAFSDLSGMAEYLGALKPPPVVNPPIRPSPDPHFYDGTSREELNTSRKQRWYPNRDILFCPHGD